MGQDSRKTLFVYRSPVRAGLALAALAVAGCVATEATPTGAAGAGGLAGTTGAAGMTTGAAGMTTGAAGNPCPSPATARMTWLLAHDATGPEVSCEEGKATTVTLLMNSKRSEFSCNAKMGTSVALTPDTYTPRVIVSNAAGTALSQGNLAPVTVGACGVIELGKIRFLVNANSTGAAGMGGAVSTGAAGMGLAGNGGAGTTGAAGTGAAGSTGAAGMTGGTGPCDAKPIFAAHSCAFETACHDGKGSAAAFDMKTPGWENMLVGRLPKAGGSAGIGSACLSQTTPFLVAGSKPARGLFLDKMFLVQPACGDRMPLLPPPLTPQEMDCIQRWANGLTSK
jgi:hypothetical protein